MFSIFRAAEHSFARRCTHSLRTITTFQKPISSATRLRLNSKGTRRHYSDLPSPSSSKDKSTLGVFGPTSAVLFVTTGVGLYLYFRNEKNKLLEQRRKEREPSQYGRPQLGGPFTLNRYTHSGEAVPFSELDLLGKWNLVYFGFTNCPDICPAELDKITAVLQDLEKTHPNLPVQPIFISVDPARDDPRSIHTYLADFHPSFIGLVGSYEATKAACRKYRVYFSTPPDADPKGDYLVDHSIFIYLMNPEGGFCDAFGQIVSREEIHEKIGKYVKEFEDAKRAAEQ